MMDCDCVFCSSHACQCSCGSLQLGSLPRIDLFPILYFAFSLSRTGGLSDAFLMKWRGTNGLLLGDAEALGDTGDCEMYWVGVLGPASVGRGGGVAAVTALDKRLRGLPGVIAGALSEAEVIVTGLEEPMGSSGVPGTEAAVKGVSHSASAKWSRRNLPSISNRSRRRRFTHFDSSTHPPPTRTMTVLDRRMRQKYSFALPSAPIQYLPV